MVEEVTKSPTSQYDEKIARRSLLLGILVWFAHQNIVYSLTSVSCKWLWFPFNILGISGLQFVEVLITLAALAGMAYLIYLPARSWRRYQTEKPTENPHLLHDTEQAPRPLLAFVAMGLNSFFALFILANFVIIFALNACRQG